MTYREIAMKATGRDDEKVLFAVGEWFGNEGQRALDFPDACPLNLEDDSDIDDAELQEYLEAQGIEV